MSDAAIVEDTGEADPATPARARGADGKFAGAEPAPVTPAAPATPAVAPAKVAGSIATGADAAIPAAPVDWPSDWQDRIAKSIGGDDAKAVDKALKQIKRYASVPAIWEKATELEGKLSAGGLVKVPGKNATEEERAAFFRAQGVPEKVEDYWGKVKLAKDRVVGEADRPVFDYFAKRLHAQGATPALMSELMDAKLDYDQEEAAKREENDDLFMRQSLAAIKQEWGGSYNANVHAIDLMFKDAAPEVRSYFESGRTFDGRKTGDDPFILKWLASTALALGYDNQQNHGADGTSSAGDELAALRQKARDKPNDYTKADEARQTQLIEQQQGKRGRRAA